MLNYTKILHKFNKSLTLTVSGMLFAAGATAEAEGPKVAAPESSTAGIQLPEVPFDLPEPAADGNVYINNTYGRPVPLTLNGRLQEYLTGFTKSRNNPIAALVVVEVATGRILAIAQGRHPDDWGATSHSALHNGFPAASLFKTVVTAAALEIADVDENEATGLSGGCSKVGESGTWMKESVPGKRNLISLTRAFGKSCNGYFAKIGVNQVGLGPIMNFAHRFGWGKQLSKDFYMDPSPFKAPPPETSSAYSVGRFAAGFGNVGISAIHAAWLMMALANDGIAKPLVLYQDTKVEAPANPEENRLVSVETARRLRSIMNATVRGGTASSAFKQRKFRDFKETVGGKTGTLTGHDPQGLTTWFTGMMPLENPEIVVAAVVILGGDKWFIKGPSLAAEAFWAYHDLKRGKQLSAIKQRAETLP